MIREPRLVPVFAALALAFGVPSPAECCDSTSCMMMTRGGNGVLGRRALRVDVSFRHTQQDRLRSGGDAADLVLRPKVDFERQRLIPGYHGERGGHEQFVQLDLSYGLTSRVTLLASAPLVAHRSYEVVHGSFEHVYDTTSFGDMVVGARYALDRASRTVAGLSAKLPTGRSRLVSPFDGGIHDPMLQPGSGSSDVVATLQTSRRALSVDWSLSGSYQANTTNGLGYRFGNDAIGTVGASRTLVGDLAASLQVKAFLKGRSVFLDEDVPSTGGRVVYVTPGLRWTAPGGMSVYGFVQVPAYRYVNESQLAPRVGVLLGVARTFAW
jgi:hypothetical protein